MNILRFLIVSIGCVVIFGCKKVDVVDQSQTEQPQYNSSVDYISPAGQSFTPAANKIEYIKFSLSDNSTANISHGAYVNIREGSINGNIIGVSNEVELEDCFNREEGPGCEIGGGYSVEVRFEFPEPVSLVPGTVYVAQIVTINSRSGLGVSYSLADEYDVGEMISNGYPEGNQDLWFEEGYTRMVPDEQQD